MKKTRLLLVLNRNVIIFVSLFFLMLTGCKKQDNNLLPTQTLISSQTDTNTADLVSSETQAGQYPAILTEFSGLVMSRQPSEEDFRGVVDGLGLVYKSQVKTFDEALARIDMQSGAIVRLGPNTLFTMEEEEIPPVEDQERVRLDFGRLWIILAGGSLEVDTPSGLAAVRGSYLSIAVLPDTKEVVITCLEGECELKNGAGSVSLVAGEIAYASNLSATPPVKGWMHHDDVNEWLQYNPEATLVVMPLTRTVSALASSTPGATRTPLYAATTAFAPTTQHTQTVAALTTTPTPGAATSTATTWPTSTVQLPPTFTPWPSVTQEPATSTPAPQPTATEDNSSDPEPGPPPQPTDAPTFFSSENGPPGGLLGACHNNYSVNVSDENGLDWVIVQYSLNSASFSAATSKLEYLAQTGTTSWGKNFFVNTSFAVGTDTVYWRFAAKDTLGNQSYSTSSYSFEDNFDCGMTGYSPINYPTNGAVISSIGDCTQLYEVTVDDLDSISEVTIQYKVSPSPNTWQTYIPKFPRIAGDAYSGTYEDAAVYISAPNGSTVEWQFMAWDANGTVTYNPPSPWQYTISLAGGCP